MGLQNEYLSCNELLAFEQILLGFKNFYIVDFYISYTLN